MLSASATCSTSAESAASPHPRASRAPPPPFHPPAASPTSSTSLSAAPQSSPTLQNGPIHLHKDNFPLLHSLLQSPEYLDAVAQDPQLARRSSTRHPRTSRSSGARSSRAQHTPPSSGAGVADLWSKVPRAFSTASSVAGSFRTGTLRRQHLKKQSGACEIIEAGPAVTTLRDEAAASRCARGPSGSVAAEPKALVQLRTEPASPRLLASHSLPNLPTTTSFPPIAASLPSPYPSRVTQSPIIASHSHPPPSRPSTAFASAVSSLKRMLSRSTRSTRSRSFGTESALSVSITFGDGGATRGGGRRSRATSGPSGLVCSSEPDLVEAASTSPRRLADPPSSLRTTSPSHTASSKPPVSIRTRPRAPPAAAHTARPASLSAYSVAQPSLDVAESTSRSYASYGRRWEGPPRAASPLPNRRSLSVRRAPVVRAAAGEEDVDDGEGRVWSKWKRWVRERREAMRRQDVRTDLEQ